MENTSIFKTCHKLFCSRNTMFKFNIYVDWTTLKGYQNSLALWFPAGNTMQIIFYASKVVYLIKLSWDDKAILISVSKVTVQNSIVKLSSIYETGPSRFIHAWYRAMCSVLFRVNYKSCKPSFKFSLHRASYYEVSVDDGPWEKQKSSGLNVCTGTGSKAW